MDLDDFLHLADNVSVAMRALIIFAGTALIPLVYLAVTQFRGRVWLPMLSLFAAQAILLIGMNPAGNGVWARFPILLEMWLEVEAADAGVVLNAVFGILYLLVLAWGAMAERAEGDAIESFGRGKVWMVAILNQLHRYGRWIVAGVLVATAMPSLFWGWELMGAKPALVHDSLDPKKMLPGFVIPYWEVYRAAILVGALSALAAAVLIARRWHRAASCLGVLTAAAGTGAFVLSESLGYGFWHPYGHAVHDLCSGQWWYISRFLAIALGGIGLTTALGPAFIALFRIAGPRDHSVPGVRSGADGSPSSGV